MREEFIPYDLALELNELGFDIECFCAFDRSHRLRGKIIHSTNNDYLERDKYDSHLPAPLFQQAFKWFREKHLLHSCISAINNGKELFYGPMIDITDKQHKAILDFDVYETYEEAELECLKKLIELCKNN